MSKATNYEQSLRGLSVVKRGEFKAHNGEIGYWKVELDDIFDEGEEHQELRGGIVSDLSGRLGPHKPEIIIPVPKGANALGRLVGRELGVRVVYLDWRDKEQRLLKYVNPQDRIVVGRAGRVALLDDVLRTGLSFEETIEFTELKNKTVVAGVVWDRRNPADKPTIGIPVEAVVSSYVPMSEDGSS